MRIRQGVVIMVVVLGVGTAACGRSTGPEGETPGRPGGSSGPGAVSSAAGPGGSATAPGESAAAPGASRGGDPGVPPVQAPPVDTGPIGAPGPGVSGSTPAAPPRSSWCAEYPESDVCPRTPETIEPDTSSPETTSDEENNSPSPEGD
ncbi:hypothetical protein ABT390_16640 [Streptomyces aurantiacus]|uniref:hypothetical protein n=1 Tax=Streptomyces aurantiacus TaxID=47760 RepID=UPI00332D0AD5